jgi:cytochrome c-type biogenesis protein CcmH/NrfG
MGALWRHLARHPADHRARLRLAETYFQAGDHARALTELRAVARADPRNPDVFVHQAVILKSSGHLAHAEQAARRALTLRPDHAAAQEWLGEIYLEQRQTHRALALFERCLKRRPDAYFALLGKGRALEQLLISRHPIPLSRVVAPVEKAVQQDPERAEGLATLARMRFTYQERLDEAEQLAVRAAERDPERALPHLLLAQIALARSPSPENLQRAGQHAYEAGRRDPADPRPPYLIGRVALQQNDVARAIRALELSLSRGPMPEAVSQLAAAHRRTGNRERAAYYAERFQEYTDRLGRRNALLAARERHPQQIEHLYGLVELYLQGRQPDTAAEWLGEARRLRPGDPRLDVLVARIRKARQKGGDGPLLPIP